MILTYFHTHYNNIKIILLVYPVFSNKLLHFTVGAYYSVGLRYFNPIIIITPDSHQECNFMIFTTSSYFIPTHYDLFLVNPVPKTYNISHYTPQIHTYTSRNTWNYKISPRNTPWSTSSWGVQDLYFNLSNYLPNCHYIQDICKTFDTTHIYQNIKVKPLPFALKFLPWIKLKQEHLNFSRKSHLQVFYIILVKVLW